MKEGLLEYYSRYADWSVVSPGSSCLPLIVSISTARESDIEYMITTGTAAVDKFSSYAIVIASLKLPAGINIKASM